MDNSLRAKLVFPGSKGQKRLYITLLEGDVDQLTIKAGFGVYPAVVPIVVTAYDSPAERSGESRVAQLVRPHAKCEMKDWQEYFVAKNEYVVRFPTSAASIIDFGVAAVARRRNSHALPSVATPIPKRDKALVTRLQPAP